MLIRLNKWIASCGFASRRAADELIASRKVKVNGQIVTQMGVKIDPEKDQVEIGNKKLVTSSEKVYIAVNKPVGVVSTAKDELNRPSVVSLVKLPNKRVYPVGRLDFDSRGLMLLTDDGELTFALTHPRFHVPKVYILKIKGVLTETDIKKMQKGVLLEDGFSKPFKATLLKADPQVRESFVEVVMNEGRKRQIRRMCQKLDWYLVDLQRVKIGPLELGDLAEGEWRHLTNDEIVQLKNALTSHADQTK